MKPNKIVLRPLLALLVTVIGLGAGLPAPVQAFLQNNALQLKATAAFDGYFKYGEWLPIRIDVENQGNDVEAEVRVPISGSQGTTNYVEPVSLPSGSRKSFLIYVLPNNFSRELQVNLISQGKTLVSQKATVHPQANIAFFVGLVAPERGALSLLNGITLPGQNRPKVLSDVALSDLPERAEGLRSFDVLIFNNLDTSKLTPAQADALQNWVQAGGRLVLGGGSNAVRTISGIPALLQPVQLQGTVEMKQDSLKGLATFAGSDIQSGGALNPSQSYVAATGQVKSKESSILAGTQAIPLVVEQPVGNGHVDFIALELSGTPFNGWAGTINFWSNMLSPDAAFPENVATDVSIRQQRASQLSYALSNIPSLDLPSVQGLYILLGLYILAVGPFNYLILRWRKRLSLAWVTIPILTVLFAAGSFGIGYFLRGTDLILNRIALVSLESDGSAAVSSYLGLFSPRKQSYEITVQGQGLVSPMNIDANPFDSSGNPISGGEINFIQGQSGNSTPTTTIQGLTVNQFSMQSFMAEETWHNFGKLSGTLRMENEALKGTLRNDTAYRLTDVVVTFQSRFQRLGDLAPGQEVKVDLGLNSLTADRQGPPLSYRLYQQQFSDKGQPTPRLAELKTNIVSSILDNNFAMTKMMAMNSTISVGGSAANLQQNNAVVVLGWLDQAPPNVTVKNNRLSQLTTSLVYTSLDYQFPDNGPILLPVGMVPGNMTKTPVNGGICSSNGVVSVSMGAGEAEFQYQIPAELSQNKVTNLKLNLWRDNGSLVDMPAVSLWDWTTSQWKTIQSPILGVNVIKSPAAYISENGLVHIQLKNENNSFSCYYLDLGLEAEQAPGGGAH